MTTRKQCYADTMGGTKFHTRESVFLKNVAPSKSMTFPWKATHSKVYGQHKLYLMGKKERTQHWVGCRSVGGSGGSSRRVPNILKYIVQRTNKK